MREIKFRAWYKPYSHMVESDDVESINFDVEIIGVYMELENRGFHKLRLSDFELMQYTGLKDRNGKEIYEGDIINDSFGDRKGRIRYNIHIAAFEIAEYDGIHLLSSHNSEKYFEVIGNIYEHPHLIGKGETV